MPAVAGRQAMLLAKANESVEERPRACGDCDWAFKTYSDLRVHLETHGHSAKFERKTPVVRPGRQSSLLAKAKADAANRSFVCEMPECEWPSKGHGNHGKTANRVVTDWVDGGSLCSKT